MLRQLAIRDFVLIESLELDFHHGMTVLTGETGAGKSILVDALSLVLGDRAESGVVRQGAKRAEISAEFEIDGLVAVQQWLEQAGLETDTCLLRRSIEAEGRSRAYINGTPVTLAQLKELGEALVDIHGQHAHHALLKPAVQRDLLDAFADAKDPARATLHAWKMWQQAQKNLQAAKQEAETRLLEQEGLEAALAELAPLADVLQRWEAFQAEHQRQINMAALIDNSARLLARLEDEEQGVLRQLSAAQNVMRDILDSDASLAEEMALLQAAISQIEEVRHGVVRYADKLSMDPERMAQLDQQMAEGLRIARKHRLSPQELPERQSQWTQRLHEIKAGQDIAALEEQLEQAEQVWRQHAEQLSVLRQQAASRLSQTITRTMAELALSEGRFEVDLKPVPPHAHGKEEIRFLVSSHASLALDSLEKTASGGELSRISLAIQTALSGQAGVPTLIFDEVDVGVGGAVAEAIGKRLAQLADHRQVLVVTHLAQVAAWSDRHCLISKLSGTDKVVSRVNVLDDEARVHEIARMMGGKELTATILQHAREMLATASADTAARVKKSARR